jgi:hypothetical protein
MDDRTAGAGDAPVDRIPPTGQLTRHTLLKAANWESLTACHRELAPTLRTNG